MRPFTIQLFAILLTATTILLPAQETVPPRQAWTEGFWQQLPDDDEDAKTVTAHLQPSSTTNLPLPAILPCPHQHFLYLDVLSWQAVAVILFITAICASFRFHAWYQEPSRRTRRLARKHLRQWLRSNPDGLPSDFTARLQQAFGQPDSANLLQLADAVQSKHPQLAVSLRQFEHERFSSENPTKQTISTLRKFLRNALMIALLLCMSACSKQFSSQWEEGVRLAHEGRLQESLDIFTELSKTHSLWQLSHNIAVLHAYLHSPHDAFLWMTHRDTQRKANGYGGIYLFPYAPELILPLAVALLCATFFQRGFKRILLVIAAVIAIVLFVAAIRPRLQLRRTAIITIETPIVPIPSDAASPTVSFGVIGEGVPVRIAGEDSINNCIQITNGKIHGWLPWRNALFFHSP
jgi:hypothetical protein